jgi:putative CocE/NonD family hydrolase
MMALPGIDRRKSIVILVLVALLALTGTALRPQTKKEDDPAGPQNFTKDVAVAMRDGVVLRADVWLPAISGRFPVLVYRTPYGKHLAVKATTFQKAIERGYAVVICDVRGRYASDGEFWPYQNEGRDGYDAIEWAAKQVWSNGDVGTFGLSYPGAVQWLAAVENPPHLKAMVPAMTFSTPRNFFYSGGVFDGSWLDWTWFNIAPDLRRRKNLAGPRTYAEAAAAWKTEHERMQRFLPLSELPDLKDVAPFYYEWMKHPPADPWWDFAELRGKYGQVHAAVLNISGWYDEAYGPDGATTNFNGLLAARRADKDPRTRTIIGPWTHGGQEEHRSGEREFGASAAIDYDELILRWMDHYVRGMDNGVGREKPVRIFVMGKNEWRDEEEWPLKRAKPTTYFLGNQAATPENAKEHRGVLKMEAPATQETYSEFTSDPAHPVTNIYPDYGAHDYRALADRDDVLAFDTEPLAADMEVAGCMHAAIYASADVRDFDLWVRVMDVWPNGTAWNLNNPGSEVLRASYRNGGSKPELLKPGSVYRLDLDRMLTSNVFLKAHRIRVQISGAFFPQFARNMQSGMSEMTSSEMRAGKIRIWHDAGRASSITLPVVAH